MIVALLVLFLLTTLGISYVAVTKGDKQIAGNQMTAAQAFEYAEAGISEALLRMSDANDVSGTYIGELAGTVSPGWGKYIVNDPGNSGLDPQYNATLSDGLNNNANASIDEASEHYPETGSKQSTMALASKLDYPWVKVRYKLNGANQVLYFGDHDNNPVTPPQENLVAGVPELIVTAAGRKGLGAKTVTVEAVKWPLPPVPGSVYAEGNMNFNGNSFYIDGHDHNPTAPYDTVAGATPLPGPRPQLLSTAIQQMNDLIARIPIATTIIALAFSAQLFARYRQRGGLHLLWWGIGMLTYAAGTVAESLVTLTGWHEGLFRLWYITGALLGGAPLAQGTVYLLLPRRTANVLSVLLVTVVGVAALCALAAPIQYQLVEAHRLSGRVWGWPWVRMFSPIINSYAFLFLVGGAAASAVRYWDRPGDRNRVVGNSLIAVGALLPGIGGTFTRFGYTEVLYVTEFLGLVLIFLGYRSIVAGAAPARSLGVEGAALS